MRRSYESHAIWLSLVSLLGLIAFAVWRWWPTSGWVIAASLTIAAAMLALDRIFGTGEKE